MRSPTLAETPVLSVSRVWPAMAVTVGRATFYLLVVLKNIDDVFSVGLRGVDALDARDRRGAEQGEAGVPADADPDGVLAFELADVDDVDTAVLEPGEAVGLVEVDGVDGAGGGFGALGLGVELEIGDGDGD